MISSVCALFGTVSDYFFDTQLILSSYDSWNATPEKEFPLKLWLYDIFVFLVVTISASHIINSILLFSKMHFCISSLREKALYAISFVTFPIFYLMSYSSFMLKSFIQPEETLDDYMSSLVMKYQFQKTITEQKIVEGCIENILQLFMLLLISVSTPLRDKMNPRFGLVFFYLKSGFSAFSIFLNIGKFRNFQSDAKIGFIGKMVLTMSCLFFMISRALSLIFCLMFSKVLPDLPYFLYYVSSGLKLDIYHSNEVYTRAIRNNMNYATPRSLNILHSITISNTPAIVSVLLILSSTVILIVSMLYIRRKSSNMTKFYVILLTALLNIFCPVLITNSTAKNKDKAQNKDNDKAKNKDKENVNMLAVTQYKMLLLLFITINMVLAVLPILTYGIDFFQVKLEILDEFMRYLRFVHFHSNLNLIIQIVCQNARCNQHLIK